MTIKIMGRNGNLLREVEADSLREALEKEVRRGAALRGAALRGADLRGADLRGAALRGADLQGAALQGADLRGASLQGADLQGAALQGADLRGASLRGANLQGAALQGADLRGADLQGADLRGADLQGADLQGAKINWQSHALLMELLRIGAGDDIPKQRLAAWIGMRTDLCWNEFLAIDDPLRDWALDELAKWIQPNDDAPEVLTSRVKPA